MRGAEGWALSHARLPSLGRAAGARYPLAVGAGGCWRWDPSPTPQRALASWLCTLWGPHGGALGGRLLPGWRASGVGRSPTPDCPSLGRAAGAGYQLAVGAGCVRVGTRHQPHSTRSCELAVRAVGAARGSPGGGLLAWVWGIWDGVLSHSQPPVLGTCGRGPHPIGLWVR